uniref:Putative tail fiber protein n=1 Tax=viral metagenome TaxID=1070528 RepID=A0A6M3ILG1_9ZZZZ
MGINLKGHGVIKVMHSDGTVEEREFKNVVLAVGKAQVAGLIGDATYVPFTAMALGTGTAAATTADTALGTELTTGGFTRTAVTFSRVTTDDANDTAQMIGLWTSSSAATVAVTEVGVFNTLTIAGSVPLGRQTFAEVNIANIDIVQITYKFDVD